MATNYAATATTSQRPHLSNNRSPADGVARTKILLLGLRRAGKTSIQQFLFNNMQPSQTFYLETTMRITKHAIDTIIPLEIWDCPANTTVESLGVPLAQFATIIFVIDIRDLYNQPISKLVEFIIASYEANPDIILEVFVHKAEKLQEDDKIENFRQIHERVSDRLLDMSPEYEQMQLNFHLTSIYDNTLHEAFSRVLQKLTEPLPYLEELMNVFCANSQSSKAFLFDINSKLYVATDASPVDAATHNLCCDYLNMLNNFMPLYKSALSSPDRHRQLTGASAPTPTLISTESSRTASLSSSSGKHSASPTPEHSQRSTLARNASTGFLHTAPPPVSTIYPSAQHDRGPTPPLTPPQTPPPHTLKAPPPRFYPYATTTMSLPSQAGTRGTTTITYHAITKNLALMALVPTTVFEERRGLVEYNVVALREGVQGICETEEEARGA
ncbi:hypothetical protein HYPSUDRAFT_49256 [Hypholoma sublateritium FD-334 SS-4]|uniref:GTP-binding protein n=1 Tax=Hypholoma sublateritium (strain FD-334 SS-4) TaxID=945553 RepID=A0A0D2KIB8_HYPSF|nr:hypothetical protein HYPSUDRAFT_49256 [Hypholoma sublateritium FD-334 SS-4]